MAGEIFISYRRADEAWARLLHSQLRAEGVEAWYDVHIGAGQDWRLATAKALQHARIFVLLFSQAASESEDIAKELAAATLSRKLIVPVRIEDVQPTGAFLYELAARNWVNAFDNREAKLAGLAQSLATLVKSGTADESVIPFDRNAGAKAPSRKRLKNPVLMAAAAIAMAAVLAILVWSYPRPAIRNASFVPSPGPAGISVAVLPFLNLSSDKDQEFFSDGMTEEITSALAKVPGLAVIGRTSAFQFKGENKDMRAIGKALGARNLIEGSVRKAGDQVRITVQLIKAADGTHLWTESYDRKLTDIFAVQEDIATAIAGALQVPLGLRQSQNLVANRTGDLGAYQQYLEARADFRARRIQQAKALLQKVVARDPKYAPAWSLLASANALPSELDAVAGPFLAGSLDIGEARARLESVYQRAEQTAREALRLDPRNAMAYHALANVESWRGHFVASEDYRRKSLALDPNDSDILYGYAFSLAEVGRLKDARRVQTQILAQEPFVPNYNRQAADVLWAMGQNDAAMAKLKSMPADAERNFLLARIYATAGHFAQAADAILAIPAPSRYSRETLEKVARLLRAAPAKPQETISEINLSFVYFFTQSSDRAFDLSDREMAIGKYGGLVRLPWAPPAASFRKTERFKAYARKSGFVEYWRARGWPDNCHPVGAQDFACN